MDCFIIPWNQLDIFIILVIRDFDGRVYFREWSGGLMAGGFEPEAKPAFHTQIPDKFEFQLLPEDWDHFRNYLLCSFVKCFTPCCTLSQSLSRKKQRKRFNKHLILSRLMEKSTILNGIL